MESLQIDNQSMVKISHIMSTDWYHEDIYVLLHILLFVSIYGIVEVFCLVEDVIMSSQFKPKSGYKEKVLNLNFHWANPFLHFFNSWNPPYIFKYADSPLLAERVIIII